MTHFLSNLFVKYLFVAMPIIEPCSHKFSMSTATLSCHFKKIAKFRLSFSMQGVFGALCVKGMGF